MLSIRDSHGPARKKDRDWLALYALQDRVIARMRAVEQGFYLSGGTAISRGYYGHRYSEDLDFFVNYSTSFGHWRDKCFDVLSSVSQEEEWRLDVLLSEAGFGRAFVHSGSVSLKLEFINDVPARVGVPWPHPTLGMLDTKENILANKITALVDREEPKDVADIYWLCCEDTLDIMVGLRDASTKAAGDFPLLVVRELEKWRKMGVSDVIWLRRPDESRFVYGLTQMIETIQRKGKML